MSAPLLRVVGDDDVDVYDVDPAQDQAERLNDAAMAVAGSGHHGIEPTAVAMLKRAIKLRPDIPDIWSNLGLIHWRTGSLEDAEICFRRAVHLAPDSHTYQGNIGIFLGAIGRPNEALTHLETAVRLDPENLGPRWDRCLLYLREGNWKKGLFEYDVRREHRGEKLYPKLPVPMWQGENLDGKTLYIQGEQGVGDRFLFSRYFVWIKETWPTCRIRVCVHDSMVNMFWEFRDVVDFLPLGIPWPDGMDYGIYLCSLPAIHQSEPDHIPPEPGLFLQRIRAAQQRTKFNLPVPNLPSLRVGIAWTGNPEQTRNIDRSIPLELLLPLAEDPRVMLYSFQGAPGQSDIGRLVANELICDLGPGIEKEGWVGTGLAMMEMDIIITVCTSIAHLAGVLQVPCWTLLCADPYWIWTKSGDQTPWYPDSMKLFRQERLGDWRPVVTKVKAALWALADAKSL